MILLAVSVTAAVLMLVKKPVDQMIWRLIHLVSQNRRGVLLIDVIQSNIAEGRLLGDSLEWLIFELQCSNNVSRFFPLHVFVLDLLEDGLQTYFSE